MELKPLQQQAIALLAQGYNTTQVAKKLCCHRTTIYEWYKLPEFKEKLKEIVTLEYKQNLTRLQNMLNGGIDRLQQILDDPNTEAKDVIRVVSMMLQAGDRMITVELAEDVAAIKKELGIGDENQ